MGGLKSLAAVMLIKIKIVLAAAAAAAVVIFTLKYLLGYAGIPAPPGLPPWLYKSPPPPPIPHHHHEHHSDSHVQYLPVDHHEQVYGGGYEHGTSEPVYYTSHEEYGGNKWSKIGDGGRSLTKFIDSYPSLKKLILQHSLARRKRKTKRKDFYNVNDTR